MFHLVRTVACVAANTLALALYSHITAGDTLLSRADKVADVRTWEGTQSTFYRYVGNVQVLYGSHDGTGIYRLAIMNVANRQSRTLSELTHDYFSVANLTPGSVLDQTGVPPGLSSCEISSDGRRALFVALEGSDGAILACDVKTMRCFRMQLKGYARVMWLHGGDPWEVAVISYEPHKLVAYVANLRTRTRTVDMQFGFDRLDRSYPAALAAASERGYLRLSVVFISGRARADVYSVQWLSPSHKALSTHSCVTLPNGSEFGRFGAIALSPSGRRIAWLTRADSHYGVHTTSIRVSRLDGSGMSELGSMLYSANTAWYDEPRDVMWLPSERQMSFVCNGWLYRAEARP